MSLLKTFTKVLTVKIWEYLRGFSFKYFKYILYRLNIQVKLINLVYKIFPMKLSVKTVTAYIDYRVKKYEPRTLLHVNILKCIATSDKKKDQLNFLQSRKKSSTQ